MDSRTILIVGAGSDIGCELIRELSGDDVRILAHFHRSEERVLELQRELELELVPLRADLSDTGSVKGLIEDVQQECGNPNQIVLLAASAVKNIRFRELPWEEYQSNLDIQLRASVMILQGFLPSMAAQRSGAVVFMLSSYLFNVPPSALSHYVTAKYAVLGLMKSLAAEYAGRNIQINAVSPSMVETRFLANIPERLVELTAEGHPLKRNATPVDVVPAIKFLLSPAAGYITGVNIPVCGGASF